MSPSRARRRYRPEGGAGGEGASWHRSALRSPRPWRERVRVRGLPEVTRGVPVRSHRARGSDAAAHRRSSISGPCSHATPATVFADRRLPSLAAPPRGAPSPPPSPARGEGAGTPSRRPGGRSERGRGGFAPTAGGRSPSGCVPAADPDGGVGAKPPHRRKSEGGWVGQSRAACSSGMGVCGAQAPHRRRALALEGLSPRERRTPSPPP